MSRRVVITGSGVVTPLGDLAATVDAVAARRSAIAPVSAFDASSFREGRGGECTWFDPKPWFRTPKPLKLADRRTRLAVGAAAMAWQAAGLDGSSAEATGVVVGTSASDMQAEDCGRALGPRGEGDAADIDRFGERMLRRLNPLWLLVNLANMASAHIAIQLETRGPNSTITTDWIAGLQAMQEAARWIAGGEADVVIAGGADCGVLPFAYASYEAEGIFGTDAPSFVPADGAGMFVLEELEHARKRGTRILGEVLGHATAFGEEGLSDSIRRAFAMAGGSQPDLVCDAAAFTPALRSRETRALATALNRVPQRFELHSLTGHPLAASAPIALAVALARATEETVLVNSLGAFEQACALVVRSGDPD